MAPPRTPLPPALLALADRQSGVVTRSHVVGEHLHRRVWDRCASGLLSPVLRGAMAVTGPRHEYPAAVQRAQAAYLLTGGGDPLACISSALRLHDIQGSPFGDPEHVTSRHPGPKATTEIVRHRFGVPAAERTVRWGIPCVSARLSLLHACRTYDQEHAVSALDSALRHGRVGSADLAWITAHLGRRRRGWLRLVDAKAESPLETRGRLLLIAGGLPWRSQVPIRLASGRWARADFLVGERLVIECDGRGPHDPIATRYADARREEALRAAGFEVIRLRWADVVDHPQETLARIRAALAWGRVSLGGNGENRPS